MKSILFLLLTSFFLGSLATPVTAGQSDSCHCFRNRSYDPANKFAADDYLLTTSFNSLIAATLQVSKKQIVMMKMKGGVDPDTLLTALYIADKTNMPVDALLSIHDNGTSWQTILNDPSRQQLTGKDPLLAEIAAGATEKKTTQLVTNAMLASQYQAEVDSINSLRSAKFSNREISLLFALQQQTTATIKEITPMYRQGGMSWSEISHQFNLSPSAVGKNILNTVQPDLVNP